MKCRLEERVMDCCGVWGLDGLDINRNVNVVQISMQNLGTPWGSGHSPILRCYLLIFIDSTKPLFLHLNTYQFLALIASIALLTPIAQALSLPLLSPITILVADPVAQVAPLRPLPDRAGHTLGLQTVVLPDGQHPGAPAPSRQHLPVPAPDPRLLRLHPVRIVAPIPIDTAPLHVVVPAGLGLVVVVLFDIATQLGHPMGKLTLQPVGTVPTLRVLLAKGSLHFGVTAVSPRDRLQGHRVLRGHIQQRKGIVVGCQHS